MSFPRSKFKAPPPAAQSGAILLRRILLWLIFIAPQAQHASQLGRQRIAVAKRLAGPAEQPRVLELPDVR